MIVPGLIGGADNLELSTRVALAQDGQPGFFEPAPRGR
jgi:hypothetical protein